MPSLSELAEHLLHSSPDALLVIDEAGVIQFANETVDEVFGHSAETLVGRPLETLVPLRLRERHAGHVVSFIRSPHNREMGAQIRELYALRADGSEFPAHIRLAPLRVGGKLYVAAAVRDATDRVRASEQLVAAREEAERANRAKSRFLATASHDLRQPIHTIRLLNAALLRVVPETAAHDLLQEQGAAIDAMTKLLNALLDIGRLESGAIDLLVSDVSLSHVCRELRSEFSTLAASKDIDLYIADTSLGISTDRALFYQLLQNLVANAIKYTERGSVRLSFEEQADCMGVVIEDTGIGIPSDKLARIFDEYYQVDTHGAKRMGVGLGLAIVKEVARLLGVSVTISSTLGSGTHARVDIPRRMLLSNVPGAMTTTTAASDTKRAKQSRLFLVEDNDAVRRATETFLSAEGFQTLSATNVADAERLFQDIRPGDVVIADFHLDTRHTGLDLLNTLRQRVGYDVPGIILSGDLTTVVRTAAKPTALCVFLSKPVDVDALVQAINTLTSQAAASR